MTQVETTRPHIIDLSLDTNDPHRLAHFWAAALGWELHQADDGIALIPTDDTGFGVLIKPDVLARIELFEGSFGTDPVYRQLAGYS